MLRTKNFFSLIFLSSLSLSHTLFYFDLLFFLLFKYLFVKHQENTNNNKSRNFFSFFFFSHTFLIPFLKFNSFFIQFFLFFFSTNNFPAKSLRMKNKRRDDDVKNYFILRHSERPRNATALMQDILLYAKV
jgi:predicted membrane protein